MSDIAVESFTGLLQKHTFLPLISCPRSRLSFGLGVAVNRTEKTLIIYAKLISKSNDISYPGIFDNIDNTYYSRILWIR